MMKQSDGNGRKHELAESYAFEHPISLILDNTINLILSNDDRQQVIWEVKRLEKVTIVAQVLGIHPNRAELHLLLQATLKEELVSILDNRFLGRGFYQLEFEEQDTVQF